MATFGASSDLVACSFCRKSQRQVAKLIAGPGVYICNECVDLCVGIIGTELDRTAPASEDPEWLDTSPPASEEQARVVLARRGLAERLGRAPTIDELAVECEMPAPELTALLRLARRDRPPEIATVPTHGESAVADGLRAMQGQLNSLALDLAALLDRVAREDHS